MDELRLEKLIEETLSTMDPVEVPKDLHFDAAKIMRMARMEEEAEAERDPAPVSFFDRLRESFGSRNWTRFAAAAAAFAVLLGVYGFWKSGQMPGPVPGNDPSQVAEIDDPTIPLGPPEEVTVPVEPDEPVVPDVPEQPPVEEDPSVEPAPAVTPQQPTQSAQNNPKPKPQPSNPTPAPVPDTQGEEPVVEDEPVEEEPGEVDQGSEYAGGMEIDPDEQTGEEPADEEPTDLPEEPGEENPDEAQAPEATEDDIYENMLQEALQDESFKAKFDEVDKGFGHSIQDVQEVPEGTKFMVYFYESEEEQLSGTINEEDIRSILWEKESL
jgi:hypothetical protein